MSQKIALLALAVFFSVAEYSFSITTPTPHKSRPFKHSRSNQALQARTVAYRTARSRRARRWNPWRLSSFGDPAAGDNVAGEDPGVRAAALNALGHWNGSLAVVDPNSGRILSIVNQRLALESAFTPCSAFKPIVALGALKEGIINSETELRVGRRAEMNLTAALAHSNNVYFSKLGQMLGFDRVGQYARDFGLGEKAGYNIPEESPGYFPAEPPKVGGVGMLTSFGVGIEVTPLQMAAVASALANGGTLYYLQYPRTPEEIAQFQPMVRRRIEGLEEYLPYLKQGMAAAVLYGTAKRAYDPEEQIFGKTGTCSEDGARLGWFVSYSSDLQPRYVVVVLLRGGRPMAGPHAAEIAGKLYRDLKQREQTPTRASRVLLPGSPFER